MEESLRLTSRLDVVLSCPHPPVLALPVLPAQLAHIEAHPPASKFAMSLPLMN